MTDYIKGGRGKKAPYKTVVIRVPEPLQEAVEQLIETYRITGKIELNKPVTSLNKPVTSLDCKTCNQLKTQTLEILEGVFPIQKNNSTKARKAIEQVIELLKP